MSVPLSFICQQSFTTSHQIHHLNTSCIYSFISSPSNVALVKGLFTSYSDHQPRLPACRFGPHSQHIRISPDHFPADNPFTTPYRLWNQVDSLCSKTLPDLAYLYVLILIS